MKQKSLQSLLKLSEVDVPLSKFYWQIIPQRWSTGPATVKLLSPITDSVREAEQVYASADRRCRRPTVTDASVPAKHYTVAPPKRQQQQQHFEDGGVHGLLNLYGNAVITIAIRLRFDYDVSRAPASVRRDSTRAKN